MNTSNQKPQIHPILLIGGSGIVGRWTAHFLREDHPQVPLLLGGRDLARAEKTARELGNAEAVKIDLNADDLGLGDRPISAVAIFFTDATTAALCLAQARGVPYLTISPALNEIGPELAAFIHQPRASALVLGTEWLVGATTMPALMITKEFGKIDAIKLGALLDEEDASGPAANADLERQTQTMPSALTRREGAYLWRTEDEKDRFFHAVDGRKVPAFALTINDVAALATVTGSPEVEFNLAIGETSSRRRGEAMSTEIIIELTGEDQAGQPLRTRHAVVHPEGQMPLTGFGVALLLERLTGLDGQEPTLPGLYFPYQLLESTDYLNRLQQMGGQVLKLDLL